MPNIVILGSCTEEPYVVLAPNRLDPILYKTDHEKAYEEACKVFYPAIEKADVVLIWCPSGILGNHTYRDLLKAIREKKKIAIITKKGIQAMVPCYHCQGTGKVQYTDYPASGATIKEEDCGVCQGLGLIPEGSKGNKSYNEPGGREE